MKVGVLVETFDFTLPLAVPLDPTDTSHVYYYWNEGPWAYDSGSGKLIVPVDGRYHVTGWVQVPQDPDDDLYVTISLGLSGGPPANYLSNGVAASLLIPAGATLATPPALTFSTYVEMTKNVLIGFSVNCIGGTPNVYDSAFSIEYKSVAVGL